MKAIYFSTRTLARNAVSELNGKFKDFGKDAAPGERWAVLVEDHVHFAFNETQDKHEEWKRSEVNIDKLNEINDNFIGVATEVLDRNKIQEDVNELYQELNINGLHITPSEAVSTLNRPGSIIGEQLLKTPNKKPVTVFWRRNMTAMRLSHHINQTA